MMDNLAYTAHYETIKSLVMNLGMDAADDYLREELRNITKEVVFLREKTEKIKAAMDKESNQDEKNHLRYDLEDAHKMLDSLLHKLKVADERYVCFKEFLRRRDLAS